MTGPAPAALIAVDWGTTSLRVWALDTGGGVIGEARSRRGVRETARAAATSGQDRAVAFEAALAVTAGHILERSPEAPVIMCGMVGSRDGWVEVPYVRLPAGIDDIAQALVPVQLDGRRGLIVPGLLQAASPTSSPDVMRGEETQCVGILAQVGAASSHTVVLPGTHTKWVEVADGAIRSMATSMTGELWDAVMEHTIVGLGTRGGDIDMTSFERGRSDAAGGSRDLAGLLFAGRALMLTGDLAPAQVASYVSGVLIGDEVTHHLATLHPGTPLQMAGDPALTRLYAAAAQAAGVGVDVLPDPTRRGLWELARRAGLVAHHHPYNHDGGEPR